MFALCIVSLIVWNAHATVSEYAFSSSMGTYTEFTGGTVLGSSANDDESFNAIPLGFPFIYNGVQQSVISVQTDGFLAFGPTVLNSTLAISSATGTNNIASALNRDIMSRADGELSYLLTGTAPNRVFVVQWKNYRRILTTAVNDIFNFQIQLHENSNSVVFAYGAFTLITLTTAQTVQVGLRGDSNADFNNRTTTTNWAATIAGTAANASCTINASVFPPNGLVFSFSPAVAGPPLPAQIVAPANNSTGVTVSTNLSWANGGGQPSGYRVYLGTDNPPTDLVNGTIQTGTVYDHPVNLSYSTQYFWQIIPFNNDGDAVGCPVWSFTTMQDPTVSIFPYLQGFDSVTPPALPPGWAVLNLNSDIYTWASIADPSANSAPNAMRIRYNDAMAMNDWLISPPFMFTAGGLYRIEFFYRAGSADFSEKLALYLGSEPLAASLTTELFINTNITNTVYQSVVIMLPASQTGVNYLGFKGFSAQSMYHLYIDSFSVQEIPPALQINPTAYDFGNVNIGDNSSHSFTLANTGGANVVISSITVSGSPMYSLTGVPVLPLSLGIGGTGTFSAVFAPTTAGPQTATVTITDNLARLVYNLPLSGTGFLMEPFNPPTNLAAQVTGNDVHLSWSSPAASRALLGYKVFRDNLLLSTIDNPTTLTFDDMDLNEGSYSYTVTAIYTSGESIPAGPVTATVLEQLIPPSELSAQILDNDITLNWTSPHPPMQGNWITWSNDVLGNSVGTNAAAQFIVAQRWDQTDLVPYQGGAVAKVKFIPSYANCVYTVMVWTGGTPSGPGDLVSSQVAQNIEVEEWNTVILPIPVQIPTAGELWVGYHVNTQGGYPASVDYGPAVEGKGNMMFFGGVWTTLSALSSTLVCNWLIEAFVAEGVACRQASLPPILETPNLEFSSGTLSYDPVQKVGRRDAIRALTGFRVYRDEVMIASITDPSVWQYTDMNMDDGTYQYGVSAVYSSGESEPVTIGVTVDSQMAPVLFVDYFENHPSFASEFPPWTLIDVDQSDTYGFSNISFPGSQQPSAFIVFSPNTTVPPMQGNYAYDGTKMLASFAAITPPNNDWVVSPRINLGTNSVLRFYARSHASYYGLERFRVGVTTLGSIVPQGFQFISGVNYVQAPTRWTEYTYDLSAYDNQHVYIGIQCVSNNSMVFYLDRFSVHSEGGSVDNDDPASHPIITELKGNYPNPFNPSTSIRFSLETSSRVEIDIYNIKGQKVRSLLNEPKAAGEHNIAWDGKDGSGRLMGSGVYYYRMRTGSYVSSRKMILMK